MADFEWNPEVHRVFTPEELSLFDGAKDPKMYIAVKGIVFDVSSQPLYAPGRSYNVFCGKDASRGLAKSSVAPADTTGSLDDLGADELATLLTERLTVVHPLRPNCMLLVE